MADDFALYRYFDISDRLLYVGKSGNLATRGTVHIRKSQWMQFAARSTIERYDSPESLGDAERTAIQTEHPVFNHQYNDTPEARERLHAYLEEAGRLDLMPTARKRTQAGRKWCPPERGDISEDLLEEITAIRTAFSRVIAATLASPDVVQGFRDMSDLGNLSREMKMEAASLRAEIATQMADADALSLTKMAPLLGVSRSRVGQIVAAGRKRRQRSDPADQLAQRGDGDVHPGCGGAGDPGSLSGTVDGDERPENDGEQQPGEEAEFNFAFAVRGQVPDAGDGEDDEDSRSD